MTDEYLRHRRGVAELTQHLIQYRNPDMDKDELLSWFLAGFLHDIGKEVIDKRHPGLLEKTTPLSDDERNILQTHTESGYEMLKKFYKEEMSNSVLAALEHHERWNGSGYMGKKELEISLPGRVVAVADVYVALCHDRPYRKAWDKVAALNYMDENNGILFDPEWADALIAIKKTGGKI